MGTARDEAVSQIEAYLRRTLLAMDAGEHWVTVNAGSKTGGEGGGSHVMLDGEGRVVAGMGGKFRGTKVDDIPRKKFINEQAYQRRQESAKKAAASAPKTAQTAPKSAASAPKSAQTAQATAPKLNMHPSLKRNADGSLSAKFTGYPGGEVISRLKEQGFKYDGETKTWTLSKRRATDETVAEVNKAMHDLKPVKNMSFAERSPYESIRPNWLHDAPPQASGPISKPASKVVTAQTSKSDKPTSPAQTAKQQALKQRSEQFRSELGTGSFRTRLDADKDTMSAAGMAVKDHYYSEPLKEGHNYMKVPSPIVRETDRAVAISGRGDSYVKNGELQYRDTVWLPKSHVDIKDGQVIGLSNWIAEEKGLAPLGYQYKTTVQGNTASTSKKLSRMSETDGNRELVMLGRMRNSGKPNALYNQASSATAKLYFAPFEKEDQESGS